MKRIGLIVGGLAAILIGVGLVMPAVSKLQSFGYLPTADVRLLLLGLGLALAGPVLGWVAFRRRRT